MLFLGNATAMTGILHYYKDIVGDDQLAMVGFFSLGTFCLLIMIFECFYRRTNRKTDMTVKTPSVDKTKSTKFLDFTSE